MVLTEAQANLIGSALSFGSNIGSAFINSALSSRAAKKAFNYNKQLLQIQQEWQERMSNTAHQREVADLRAAGLNPILSATGGSGASFGSASAPGMSVGAGQVDSDLGISSALAIKQTKKDIDLAQSQIKLNKNQDRLIDENVNNAILDGYIKHNENESIIQRMYNENAMNDALVAKTRAETEGIMINNAHLAELLKSQTYSNNSAGDFNYRRAGGYSETSEHSYSSSSNKSAGIGNSSFGWTGITLGGPSGSRGSSSAKSVKRSKTW